MTVANLIDTLIGVMTTHRNLTVMETIFTEALIPMSPENRDAALGLLPFSRMFADCSSVTFYH